MEGQERESPENLQQDLTFEQHHQLRVQAILNNINNINPNMNQATDIFNSLRVPDIIKTLPEYEGNPRLLFDFLQNVDDIISILQQYANMPIYRLWIRAIRNKIKGQANEVLNMYGTSLEWSEIKANLISHYSDKRNESSLIRDLHGLIQIGTMEDFYGKVIEILANLTNQVRIHEQIESVQTSKILLYKEMCLNVFLSGLKEPLGSNIRARGPTSLKDAFEFCLIEQNISYSKRNNPASKASAQNSNTNRGFAQKSTQSVPTNNLMTTTYQVNGLRPQPFHQFGNNFQSPVTNRPTQYNAGNQFGNNFQQFANNRQAQQPQTSNNRQNFQQAKPTQFGQNQNRSTGAIPKPVPMDVDRSGISRVSQKRPNNMFVNRNSKPPNFTFEELRNLEDTPEIEEINQNQDESFQNLDQYDPVFVSDSTETIPDEIDVVDDTLEDFRFDSKSHTTT